MIRIALHVLLAAVGDQRVKSLQKKNPELVKEIQTLADADPTEGKQKYLQWAVNKLKAGADPEEVGEAIEAFHANLKLLETKDINKFKTVEDLEGAVVDAVHQDKQSKKPELVYNSGGVKAHQVFTKPQMCEIGEGSEWCTANPTGTYWEKWYTVRSGWAMYVVEAEGEKYLAYLVNDELIELKDWKNVDAPEATHYLYDAGILKSSPREDWPQWLQAAETEDPVVSIRRDDGQVTWKSGVWKAGTWKNGVWESGTWRDGVWERGLWKEGVWHNGLWENGIWKDGVWKDGEWRGGSWYKGTWEKGTWKDGDWELGYQRINKLWTVVTTPPTVKSARAALAFHVLANLEARR